MDNIKKYWILSAIIIFFNVIGYLTLKGEALLYISNLLPVFCSAVAILSVSLVVKELKVFDFTKTA